jgi:D-3-phosphoglycerate dehydrogenase
MTRRIVLILEPEGYSPEALRVLGEIFELCEGPMHRSELLARAAEFDGIVVRLGHRLDDEFFQRATALKFVASPTTGLNHIDCEAARRCGVAVLSLRGEREFLDDIHATAEHTWALLLSLLRRIPAAAQSVLQREWNRDRFRGHELHGKTLGVVGFGRLGSKAANYGRAFGMCVIAADPRVDVPTWVTRVDLTELAAEADVVSLHVAYGADTHGMIGREFFDHIKPGAVLINTARGELIDEPSMLTALESGRLAGAALDVICEEARFGLNSSSACALLDYAARYDNLIITPHIGGATRESMHKTEVFMAHCVVQFATRRS